MGLTIDESVRWRLLDHTAPLHGDVLLPFAVEELECQAVAEGAPPMLHIWRHERALVLGMRDRRLPHARAAMDEWQARGWSTAVRNSGGAAVPLDAGVVNISMILPSAGRVNLHRDFAAMAELVGAAVRRLTADAAVQAGEITGAYCPGEYDLAIDGYKFCGIAQRRKLGAYSIQAFVVVEGSGAERARAAETFYRQAAGGRMSPHALQVREDSTRSLQELIGSGNAAVTADHYVQAVKDALPGRFGQEAYANDYAGYDPDRLAAVLETMKRRYDTD